MEKHTQLKKDSIFTFLAVYLFMYLFEDLAFVKCDILLSVISHKRLDEHKREAPGLDSD